MLRDKIMEIAKTAIEQQEKVPATAEAWMVRRVQSRHQVVTSVMVTTVQEHKAFEVWVLADLDTEEVSCL